ncbi:F510_1955 family glycosylhydrolase [Bacillus sp. FJAT-44742]|uniref:F510_1955 family glycosylhydrolase n=1 Tax=Bacillus sp. FJAT-44742 TaxID=2014005 RepID=UPI0012FEF560|nr:YCF48-related protein [Bacillus sp. FJAT-44742]
MIKIKYGLFALGISSLVLAACGDSDSPGIGVDSFTHVHGLSYGADAPYDLYMSTHHGLTKNDEERNWEWVGEPEERHDLMGFAISNEGTMISSGHPNAQSDLENPLGLMISEDDGETWDPIALHGEVDFHLLEVNANDPSIIYGIDSHQEGLFKSTDGGYNWDRVEASGFPDSGSIASIVSDPGDPESLLAGTEHGILQSDDGGETWEEKDNTRVMYSATGAGEAGHIVGYVVDHQSAVLAKSDDFGETWESLHLSLEEDVGTHVAVHPSEEGVYAVGTFHENLYETRDGGETWELLAEEGVPGGQGN